MGLDQDKEGLGTAPKAVTVGQWPMTLKRAQNYLTYYDELELWEIPFAVHCIKYLLEVTKDWGDQLFDCKGECAVKLTEDPPDAPWMRNPRKPKDDLMTMYGPVMCDPKATHQLCNACQGDVCAGADRSRLVIEETAILKEKQRLREELLTDETHRLSKEPPESTEPPVAAPQQGTGTQKNTSNLSMEDVDHAFNQTSIPFGELPEQEADEDVEDATGLW